MSTDTFVDLIAAHEWPPSGRRHIAALHAVLGEPCLLCGSWESGVINVFQPIDEMINKRIGAPAGKLRRVYSAICEGCYRRYEPQDLADRVGTAIQRKLGADRRQQRSMRRPPPGRRRKEGRRR